MLKAQSSDDLLYNLHELRPADAVRSFRRSIIEDYPEDGCAYCGRKTNKWTLDHIIPKSKGGPTRRWNLIRCCARCNGNKSDTDLLPWYRPQLFWAEHRENSVFDWMRENAAMDAMFTLEESLRDGQLDRDALAEVIDATCPKLTPNVYWDEYCELNPSSAECLIYDV